MADAKLTALTAASALAAADLFYVSQSAASRKATGTQLLALVGTAYVPLAGGTMTGALTIASGTLTASAPALNITQTLNANAAFTVAKTNVTITLSNGSALLHDWQVAGSSMVALREDGAVIAAGRLYGSSVSLTAGTGLWTANTIMLPSAGYFGIGDGTNTNTATPDVRLYRDAAATLAQRNGTTQQIFRLYNTYTDSSNYERLTLTGVAGASVNIAAETMGTGADNLDIIAYPAGTGNFVVGLGRGVTADTFNVSTNCIFGTVRMTGKDSYLFSWSSTGVSTGSPDTAFARNAAGIVEVNNGTAGTWRDLKLRNLLQTEYQQMTEMTAPAAPATNSVRIYAEDNGSGKTRLMALFATGAAQQIAIEP